MPPGKHDFDLERFIAAQQSTYEMALVELAAGRKQGHWIWFVFPQLRGLGQSSTAEFFGIASLDEAKAYLANPVLGPRLVSCTDAICRHTDESLRSILGHPDDLKFVSSMTLFAVASQGAAPFVAALQGFNEGRPDARTLEMLSSAGQSSHRIAFDTLLRRLRPG